MHEDIFLNVKNEFGHIVLKDNGEKLGWTFPEMEGANLYTADYTIKGYEKEILIERKGTIAEFAQNIFQNRFIDELKRLDECPNSYIVLEFDIYDIMNFPASSNIPKSRWYKLRVTSESILKRLIELQTQFHSRFILSGRYGYKVANRIFKNFLQTKKVKKIQTIQEVPEI